MANPNLKENKLKRIIAVSLRGIVRFFSPTAYVKLQYRYITRHRLVLKNPIRYTAKLQFLRLFVYPKDIIYSVLASKAGVRNYVEECGLKDILVPTHGVFDSYEDINFDHLPSQFVLKCTHASGFNAIILDKEKIDHRELKKRFRKYLKTDIGKKSVEKHYSPIVPQIIVEQYVGNENTLPIEYKIHVFNGKARYLYVVTGRGKDIRYDNFYIDWTPFDGAQFNGWKSSDIKPKKPSNFDEMIKIAETLAKNVVFCRVDLFDVAGKIYFNEMTFTPAKGTLIFDDDKADFEIGKWLNISEFTNSKND